MNLLCNRQKNFPHKHVLKEFIQHIGVSEGLKFYGLPAIQLFSFAQQLEGNNFALKSRTKKMKTKELFDCLIIGGFF